MQYQIESFGAWKCRRDFTDAKRVTTRGSSPIPSEPTAKRLRSDSLPFDWKGQCMLCGKSAAIDKRHPELRHAKFMEMAMYLKQVRT